MRILIAIPCMDMIPVTFVESMMRMTKPEGTSVCFHKNSLIYDSRNMLSLKAIEEKFDYVLWMDSDIVCPPDALMTMLEDIDTHPDVPMVTGLYVKRSFPVSPVINDIVDPPGPDGNGNIVKKLQYYRNYPKDSIFPVEGCGFGFVLTATSLLREVWDRFGPAFAPYAWAGEDISFCYRVKQLGHKIMCDSSIPLGHIGNYIYSAEMLNGGGGGEER